MVLDRLYQPDDLVVLQYRSLCPLISGAPNIHQGIGRISPLGVEEPIEHCCRDDAVQGLWPVSPRGHEREVVLKEGGAHFDVGLCAPSRSPPYTMSLGVDIPPEPHVIGEMPHDLLVL